MKALNLLKRFLTPSVVTSAVYFFKYKAKISPKAEVELSKNFTMGPGCTVSSFSKFKASDGPLTLGARCGFATGCFITSGAKGLIIGDNLVCGPNVVMTASNYVFEEMDKHIEDQGHSSKGIKIGNNVWVGSNSVILDGAKLGDNTIVVANSLINRKFPPNVILQGNPAKIIFRREPPQENEA